MFEMVIGEIEMVLGRVGGEKDFSERVYDIWLNASIPEERQKGFDRLATQIKRSKNRYHTTKPSSNGCGKRRPNWWRPRSNPSATA